MKHNVDNCQCLGCKIFAIAKGLAHPDIWRKNLEIIMTEAAVKGLSDDEALAYVLKEFDAKLNKGIEAGMDKINRIATRWTIPAYLSSEMSFMATLVPTNSCEQSPKNSITPPRTNV